MALQWWDVLGSRSRPYRAVRGRIEYAYGVRAVHGLVGPCHLVIVGPSGSRTTVLWIILIFCRICCLMALQWWDVYTQ